MSLVYDLFPPLLASIAQAGTGHHRVANMKKQRCIPFGVSDNNFNVTHSTKQKGIFLGFGFFFVVVVWRLRVIGKQIAMYSFSLGMS